MDFDGAIWLLLGLPLAFGLGWLASRFEQHQAAGEGADAPRAYYRGLSLLLSEQQDKAIDAFIEAVQKDPDTIDLHFALGGLFRRRGEFERAVRVHEHLLRRADLRPADRDRARHALAQDFFKAGLFDRAEAAFKDLQGSAFDTEALAARLSLHERSRDWQAAMAIGEQLESRGAGSYARRLSHYACERALEAETRGDAAQAQQCLEHAQQLAPDAPRPRVLAAQRWIRLGRHDQALQVLDDLMRRQPEAFALVAGDYATCAIACGRQAMARLALSRLAAAHTSIEVLRAIAQLGDGSQDRLALDAQLLQTLKDRPSLALAQMALERLDDPEKAPSTNAEIQRALNQVAAPMRRYRCAACGFEARQHFWQCPGCLGWDTYPPRRIEEA
jgi:lipopolysaccharide biosynthesis regulator YciM